MTDKVKLIRERLKIAQSRQKATQITADANWSSQWRIGILEVDTKQRDSETSKRGKVESPIS
jgi:hypothetical protein